MTVERVDIYLLSLKAVLTARAAGVDPAVRCFWVLARCFWVLVRCFWVLVRCFWVLRLSRTTDPRVQNHFGSPFSSKGVLYG